MNPSTNEPYGWIKMAGTLLSIPLILGLSPVVGGAIGFGLDRFFDTRPFFTLILLLTGFAAGIRETWLLIRRSFPSEDGMKGGTR